MIGRHTVAGREIPVVRPAWTPADRWGAARVRWGIGRYDYRVEPGLYAVGAPGPGAPVLVTANYKLSFDCLRRELAGQDVFVLVLQTMGINVWCAAGKGTFGTDELCRRIEAARLAEVVDHRRVILPQLGAPGVAAHEARRRAGFRVVYGPVDAGDVPRFLEDKRRATPAMRRKRFPLRERAALVPMELVPALKYGLPVMALLALLAGLVGPAAGFVANLTSHGVLAAWAVLAAVLCGAVLTPLLLPFVPGRAFALKGAILAALFGAPGIYTGAWLLGTTPGEHWLAPAGLSLFALALSSFAAMNFTGSSTYTSLSGVEREMRAAVPVQLGAAVLGLGAWVPALLWGL